MTVNKIIFNNKVIKENSFHFKKNNNSLFHFINCLTLCNNAINQKNKEIGDSTEISLINFIKKFSINEVKYRKQYIRILEIPFDYKRKLMSTINLINKQKFIYTKGDIDQLLKCCNKIYLNNKIIKLTTKIKYQLQQNILKLSNKSLRILAFAFKKYDNKEIENNLIFLGIIGMSDILRPEALKTIKKAHKANIKVIMITGDHATTALAIAKDLNLATSKKNIISGYQIDNMNNKELQEILKNISVFARVNPEHKTRIIECLQSMNYIVSMTGDGVNDVPSLNKADVGIAMGITGTDISKEAANIILQDDNFSTIINCIEEGKNVYHKIKQIIAFICASQIANVLAFIIITFSTKIKPFNSINIL